MRPLARVSIVLVLLTLPVVARPLAAAQRSDKPNVLFIVVDDLNTQVGYLGYPFVKTPHVDRLASQAVRFSRTYCQYPLCNPSRASFLSGRRPDMTKIYDNSTPPRTTLGADVVFLPEHFRKHGYFTARVGKIAHNTFEDAVTWDVSEHPRGPNGEDLHRQAYVGDRKDAQQGGVFAIDWTATQRADGDEPDGRTARRIVELLEQHKEGPFFIGCGFYRPHLPFVCPKPYFDLYLLAQIPLPQEPAEHLQRLPPLARLLVPVDARMTETDVRSAIAAYHACTSFIDTQVGLVLDALDRLKLADNTIVVFFSDHGFMLGEHGGLWRKMQLFDESVRVPLLVRVPGRKPVESNRLVELVDLYPTLAELCGLPAPAGLEGTSVVPLIDEPDRPWKKAAFTSVGRWNNLQFQGPMTLARSITTERYRYTEWPDAAHAELYDQRSDPREYNNLVDDAANAATKREMQDILQAGWTQARPQ